MSREFKPEPGWLLRDVRRAAARVEQWHLEELLREAAREFYSWPKGKQDAMRAFVNSQT
jgi:hypothetical protein